MVALAGGLLSLALIFQLTVFEMVVASRGFVAKVTTVPPAVLVNWVADDGGVGALIVVLK